MKDVVEFIKVATGLVITVMFWVTWLLLGLWSILTLLHMIGSI